MALIAQLAWGGILASSASAVGQSGVNAPGGIASAGPDLPSQSNFSSAPVPVISGVGRFGETLTVAHGSWEPRPDQLIVRWVRVSDQIPGGEEIIGDAVVDEQRHASYRLSSEDAGMKIVARVIANKDGYIETTRDSLPLEISADIPIPEFESAPIPVVTGEPAVGSMLQTMVIDWLPTPDSLWVEWLRDGSLIPGAAGDPWAPAGEGTWLLSYRVVAADAGKRITFRVTAKKAGYAETVKVSAPVTVPGDDPGSSRPFDAASVPVVSGSPQVGAVLNAVAGVWRPSGVVLSFQWKREGVPIPGATRSQYRLSLADALKNVSVTVTGAKAGYATVSKTSVAKRVLRVIVSKSVRVQGSAKVGKTLKVKRVSWSPKGVKLSYRWLRNGKAITGATKVSYRVKSSDRKKRISVRVTASKLGYATEKRVSGVKRVR